MKSKKIKNITSINDYINIFNLIVKYNLIHNILYYKNNGNNTPFYGSFEAYKNKKQSLNKKLYNTIDKENNLVFNKCFQIHSSIFEKLFGTKIVNGKRVHIFQHIVKEIKNNKDSNIIIYNRLIKNKKTEEIDQNTGKVKWEKIFETSRRYILKDEYIQKIFSDKELVKKIVNLESGYYTSDEAIIIKTFFKIREEINKKLNSNTTKETIILNTQKETKKKEVIMRTKTKRTSKIKQPKYDDIPDEPETKQNNNKEFITKLQKYVDDYIFSHKQLNDLLKALKEKPILIKGTKGDFTNDDRLKNLNNRIKLLERVIKHKNIQKNIEQKAYWTNIIKNDIYDLKKQIEKQKADKEYKKQLKAKSIEKTIINEINKHSNNLLNQQTNEIINNISSEIFEIDDTPTIIHKENDSDFIQTDNISDEELDDLINNL